MVMVRRKSSPGKKKPKPAKGKAKKKAKKKPEFPRLSASIAHKLTTESALAAWADHRLLGNIKKAATAGQIKGRLWHGALLESSKDIVVVEANDFKGEEAKEERDIALSMDKMPIARPKWNEMLVVVPQVHAALAEIGIVLDGQVEKRVEWLEYTDEGKKVPCSGYIDHFKGVKIQDLKTTEKMLTHDWCQREIVKSHALLQDPAYRSAVAALTDLEEERIEFEFVFVQVAPPFSVYAQPMAGDLRELAHLRWRRAVNEWHKCLSTGRWPGPQESATPFTAPGYLLAEELEREIMEGTDV